MAQRVVTETQEVTNVEKVMPQRVIRTTRRVVPSESADSPKAFQTKKTIFRTYQVLFYLLGLIEILLAFRFLLRLIGANPGSGFSIFIYGISGPFAGPFLGIVPASVSGIYILEWSTLIAMAVYAIVVWLIVEFFQLVKPLNPEQVEQTVDNP